MIRCSNIETLKSPMVNIKIKTCLEKRDCKQMDVDALVDTGSMSFLSYDLLRKYHIWYYSTEEPKTSSTNPNKDSKNNSNYCNEHKNIRRDQSPKSGINNEKREISILGSNGNPDTKIS